MVAGGEKKGKGGRGEGGREEGGRRVKGLTIGKNQQGDEGNELFII